MQKVIYSTKMTHITYSNRRKEFLDQRTSWKFYNRLLEQKTNFKENFLFDAMSLRIQLEILKELQFMNDKVRKDIKRKK